MKYSPLIGVGLLMLFTGMMMSAVAVANLNVIPNTVLNPLNIYPIVSENLDLPELVTVKQEINYENCIVYNELENIKNIWDENLETFAVNKYYGYRTIIDISLPYDNYLVIVYLKLGEWSYVRLRVGYKEYPLESGLNGKIITGDRFCLVGDICSYVYIYELAIYKVGFSPIRVVDKDNKPIENACIAYYGYYDVGYFIYQGCELTGENGLGMFVSGTDRIAVHKENKKLYIGKWVANVKLDDYELKGKTYETEVRCLTEGREKLLKGYVTEDTAMLSENVGFVITYWIDKDSWVMYATMCQFHGGRNRKFEVIGNMFEIESDVVISALYEGVKTRGEVSYEVENNKLIFICRGLITYGRYSRNFDIYGSAWLENNDICVKADIVFRDSRIPVDIRVKNGKELIMAYVVPSLKLPLIFIGLGMIGVGLVGTTKIEFER